MEIVPTMLWKTDDRSPIGWRLGNYRIVRLLGRGGMANVFEAVNEQIGKKVAVKVLRQEFSRNAEIERRFLNEARSVNLIPHPGLVNIFEFGKTIDDCTYIIMEYLHGDPLNNYIEKYRPIHIAKSLCIIQQIASVLAAAHAAGVIHRDLKPANIIMVADPDVAGEERPKICDFGIAKTSFARTKSLVTAETTRAGVLLGTPAYMAPEQMQEPGAVTDRADVYSLGIILTELISAAYLSRAQLPQSADAAHGMEGLAHPLPPGVEELRQSMLQTSPLQRPTMSMVRDQLRSLIASMDITTVRRGPANANPGQNRSPPSPLPTLTPSLAIMQPPDSTQRRSWRLILALALACGGLMGVALTLLMLPMHSWLGRTGSRSPNPPVAAAQPTGPATPPPSTAAELPPAAAPSLTPAEPVAQPAVKATEPAAKDAAPLAETREQGATPAKSAPAAPVAAADIPAAGDGAKGKHVKPKRRTDSDTSSSSSRTDSEERGEITNDEIEKIHL